MRHSETMPLGIIVERRASSNQWQDHSWAPVAVIPGAAPMDANGPWRMLEEGEGWQRWLAGTLTLELYRTDTEAYRTNLSGARPAVYVVLRESESGEHEVVPFAVTVSAYEAQDFVDTGVDIVEALPMTEALAAWVGKFIATHHVDKPFHKRRLRRGDDAGGGAGQAKRGVRDVRG